MGCVMHYGRNRTLERGRMRDTNLPKKRRNAQKMVILTKESKNFIKAKLTVSKSYPLGLVCFMIFCILRCDLIKITKYLCNLSVTLNIFLPLHNLFMMLVYMEVHLKGYFLMSISLSKIYSVFMPFS